MGLTKEAILKAADLPRETVAVPEWGGDVIVRTLTGTERDAFEASCVIDGESDLTNLRAKFVVRCIIDKDGKRLFTDAEAKPLGGKSALALDRLFDVAQKLNGMSGGDIEELAKNSASGPSADSPSGSHSLSAAPIPPDSLTS